MVGGTRPGLRFGIGIDPAYGGDDATGIVVTRRQFIHGYAYYGVIHIDRCHHDSYHQTVALIVQHVKRIQHDYRWPGIDVVVEANMVGSLLTEPLEIAGLAPKSIVLHGGDAVIHPRSGHWRVPKRDLVTTIHRLLHDGRLAIEANLPLAGLLNKEFKASA